MTDKSIIIKVHRSNTAVVLSPVPADGTQTVFGPYAVGQSVEISRGALVDADMFQVDLWDWDDYQQDLQDQQNGVETP